MLRTALLRAAVSPGLERAATRSRLARPAVGQFIAGTERHEAIAVAQGLVAEGLSATIDHLGEDCDSPREADHATHTYLGLLDDLARAGLSEHVEVSLKLTALGGAFDPSFALENARRVCAAADAAGTTVTLDVEDSTTTDLTLRSAAQLRDEFPGTGVVVQAMLKRTERDCRELSGSGIRVRVCKGAYREPGDVAWQARGEVRRVFLSRLAELFAAGAYPMVATHDPELIEGALREADRCQVAPGDWEFQMLYGVRKDEQRRLMHAGHRVRVYLSFGRSWYRYTCRRIAERRANLVMLTRSLLSTH